MSEKHPKRPRDLNQWAKRMVDIATGETEEREPTSEDQGKDPSTDRRRLGGQKGGKARAASLSTEAKKTIAAKAAKARWKSST